jgi:hypothetical protein
LANTIQNCNRIFAPANYEALLCVPKTPDERERLGPKLDESSTYCLCDKLAKDPAQMGVLAASNARPAWVDILQLNLVTRRGAGPQPQVDLERSSAVVMICAARVASMS